MGLTEQRNDGPLLLSINLLTYNSKKGFTDSIELLLTQEYCNSLVFEDIWKAYVS